MDFRNIVSHINSLPPLSDSTMLIQKLYSEGAEKVDIIKLVKIIESDALLAANILKMINAPFYGFSKRIASVAQAVSLFGTHTVYGLVINYAMSESIRANLSAYNLSASKFNDICQIQSHLMTQWYSKIDLRHAQFLASLCLIMESGKLIVAKEVDNSSYTAEFRRGLKKCENIVKYENDLLGTSSYFISGLLFEYWNLEPLFVSMLKNLDYEDENLNEKMERYINSLDVVRTAVNAKDILSDESIADAMEIVKDMDLDEMHFKKIALRIRAAYLKK